MARKYELKQRAESLAATRERIVEATVELHDSLGPARTTISAIAERAGVQRLTVYRHFPDERSLFEACSGHWAAHNPAPDPSTWAALDDPEERLRIALVEIYAFYRATEGMTGNLLRDFPDSPVLREVAAPFLAYWRTVRDVLDRGWTTRGHNRALLRAVIGHAVEFETWRSLARREGLDDAVAADAMVSLARAVQT
ncbi:MAG: TetR/AcrR family transcriptional regulator [Actinomycetota bacterium]|nr:TetR/AcrR family transcriptional regulator [Actinomycetota bacterium]